MHSGRKSSALEIELTKPMSCTISQCLCQDLVTGCQNLANVKLLAILFFKGDYGILSVITTINIYLLIEIRHNILIQCHRNFIEVEYFNYVLEIGILRNCPQKIGCPEG